MEELYKLRLKLLNCCKQNFVGSPEKMDKEEGKLQQEVGKYLPLKEENKKKKEQG